MQLQFDKAARQIVGARADQEDACVALDLSADGRPSGALLVVADGMGGHIGGKLASNIAIRAFQNQFVSGYPTTNPVVLLKKSVLRANTAIGARVKSAPDLTGMGCTLIAAVLDGVRLWWVSVGDSHLYLLRERRLVELNQVHNYAAHVKRMAVTGTPITPDPNFPPRALTSALMGDEIPEVDLPRNPTRLRPGDALLLASDGLDCLSAGKIVQFSAWSENAEQYVENLLNAVENQRHPRQDNASVVAALIRSAPEVSKSPTPLKEKDAQPSPARGRPEAADETSPGITAETLERLYPMNQASPGTREELADKTRAEHLAAGTRLFEEGREDPHLIYLLTGEVELQSRFMETSRLVGGSEAARYPLAAQRPRQVTATASGDIVIIRFDGKEMADLLATATDARLATDQAEPRSDHLSDQLFYMVYEAYLSGLLTVPSLPDIAIRVRRAVQNPDTGCAELTEMIQLDPVLTARLIRVANSVMFGQPMHAKSCRDAVARFGLTRTRDLVTGFALHDLFRSKSRSLNKQLLDVWTHSCRVGAIASILARGSRVVDADMAMLGGLVHDIGALPILNFASQYPELARDTGQLQRVIAALRDQVGAMVLRKWNFSEEVMNVALEAEHWYREGPEEPDLCDLVIVAQVMSFAGRPEAKSAPPVVQVPAFSKLVQDQMQPDGACTVLEQARKDTAAVMKLLS